jgi:hypothetical protein
VPIDEVYAPTLVLQAFRKIWRTFSLIDVIKRIVFKAPARFEERLSPR